MSIKGARGAQARDRMQETCDGVAKKLNQALAGLFEQNPAVPSVSENPQAAVLAEHACEIRKLCNSVKENLIEMGRRLAAVRTILKRERKFTDWIEHEFGWNDETARRYIRLYEFYCEHENTGQLETHKLRDLSIPASAIYLITAPSCPAGARDEIVERAKSGEVISIAKTKEAQARHAREVADRAEARSQENRRREASAGTATIDAEAEAARRKAEYAADEAAADETPQPAAPVVTADLCGTGMNVSPAGLLVDHETGSPVSTDDEAEPEIPEDEDEDAAPPRKSRKPQSRPARWADAAARAVEALEELQELQSEYEGMRENQPENLRGSPFAEKLDVVCDLDLATALEAAQAAADVDLPRGFGRD